MKKILLLILLFSTFTTRAGTLVDFYYESNERILFAGENHTFDKARGIFKDSLLDFRNSGGDTLGLEMIESHKQYLLDNFLKDKDNSRQDLAHYLTVRWQYNTASYMEMITKAKELGLSLLAIDLNKERWPKETGLFPVIPDISKVRIAREAHMSKILCSHHFNKIIVIIGAFHAKERFLPKGLLDECYASSKSYFISELQTWEGNILGKGYRLESKIPSKSEAMFDLSLP